MLYLPGTRTCKKKGLRTRWQKGRRKEEESKDQSRDEPMQDPHGLSLMERAETGVSLSPKALQGVNIIKLRKVGPVSPGTKDYLQSKMMSLREEQSEENVR